MAITLASLKRRVEQLARRHDLCPVHLVPLWCTCEQEWTGTEAEWEEVCELMDRLVRGWTRVHPSRVPCPRCQEWLYCDACGQAQLDGADRPADRCDQAEDARYQHLMSLMQPKPAAALAQDMTAVVQQAWQAQPSPVVAVAVPPVPAHAPLPRPEPIPAPIVSAGTHGPPINHEEATDAEVEEVPGPHRPTGRRQC